MNYSYVKGPGDCLEPEEDYVPSEDELMKVVVDFISADLEFVAENIIGAREAASDEERLMILAELVQQLVTDAEDEIIAERAR